MAGLYIHIPFCGSKCTYCDFYSLPGNEALMGDYVDAIMAEFAMRECEISQPFKTIYIGGGTPSVLPLDLLDRLLSSIAKGVDLSQIKEFTVEVNPEDVCLDLLSMLRCKGVNRISMGVQSLSERVLRIINRRHSSQKAREALEMLAAERWNFSADLIYGLPEQDLEQWHADLTGLLSFNPSHFSAYLLTVADGTMLARQIDRGELSEASEETVGRMYDDLITTASRYGYQHYEISNFAYPGLRSIHNSSYWAGSAYLGLGAGAYSFDGVRRRYNPHNIKGYIQSVKEQACPSIVENESVIDRLNDYIFTSLRTCEGLDEKHLRDQYPEYIDAVIRACRQDKRLIAQDGRWRIPEQSWLVSDAIIRDLLIVE